MSLLRILSSHRFIPYLAAVFVFAVASFAKSAETIAPPATQSYTPNHVLIVGTDQSPPFVIYNPTDKSYTGLTIELWKKIAQQLGYQYQIRYYPQFDQLLIDTAAGKIDVALSSITVNAQRQRIMDFTEPYFTTGLGIAVPVKYENTWVAAACELITPRYLELLGAVGLLLLGSGALMWLLERKKNTKDFRRQIIPGIGDGIWWSAQTMTTLGYGDVVPRTFKGRLVGMIWMFCSVVIISSFTAAITSTMTLQTMTGPVTDSTDLTHVKVATIGPDTTSMDYLAQRGIQPVVFPHVFDALTALHAGTVDAVVYDTPLLQYQIQKNFQGDLRVLPGLIRIQYYAIALPPGSPLRRDINFALLNEVYNSDWQALITRYLGTQP
jgi:polar amino acid transport system substrate-binding protein